MDTTYFEINRQSWNQRVDIHIDTDFYDMAGFLQGKNTLNEIERNLLGDIQGKSILHLQCHFGQDTISLERLGARVTGVDISDKAIEKATEIASQIGSKARFICCNLYDLPTYSDETFDIVFTSYGTISWLPDLSKWAKIISTFLKPDGRFIMAEFHPVVWMFDDAFEKVGYNYFNDGAIKENETGTYADRDSETKIESVCWNHSIGEVLNSLIEESICIQRFEEFNYSPYNCFQKTKQLEPGKYFIEHIGPNIPMVYALEAKKNKH